MISEVTPSSGFPNGYATSSQKQRKGLRKAIHVEQFEEDKGSENRAGDVGYKQSGLSVR